MELSDSGLSGLPATPASKRKKVVAAMMDLDSSYEDPGLSEGEGDLLNPPKRRGPRRPEKMGEYRVVKAEREARIIREEIERDREEHSKLMDEEYDPPLSRNITYRKEDFVKEASGVAVLELSAAVEAEMRAINRATAASRNLDSLFHKEIGHQDGGLRPGHRVKDQCEGREQGG